MASATPSVKQQARKLLDELPDDVTWDDIVYELAVRRSIELGRADVDAGRVRDRIAKDPERIEIPDEHKRILDERLSAHAANPSAGKPWNEVRDELLAKLRS